MSATYQRADGERIIPVRPGYFDRLQWRLRHRLPMWTVYAPTTREYPGLWVARMHISLPKARPTRFVIVQESLIALRDALPEGLTCIGRSPGDAPEIVEVWI